jgi:hypothetical protein
VHELLNIVRDLLNIVRELLNIVCELLNIVRELLNIVRELLNIVRELINIVFELLNINRRFMELYFLHIQGKADKEQFFLHMRALKSFETSVALHQSAHRLSYKI